MNDPCNGCSRGLCEKLSVIACDDLAYLSTTNTRVSGFLLIHPPGHDGTNVKSPSSTAASEGSISMPRWKSSITTKSFALSPVLLRANPSSWFVSSQSALSAVASDCWSRTFPLLRRIRKDAKDAGKACFWGSFRSPFVRLIT